MGGDLAVRLLEVKPQDSGSFLPSGPLVLVPNSVPRPQKGRAPDVGGHRLSAPLPPEFSEHP